MGYPPGDANPPYLRRQRDYPHSGLIREHWPRRRMFAPAASPDQSRCLAAARVAPEQGVRPVSVFSVLRIRSGLDPHVQR